MAGSGAFSFQGNTAGLFDNGFVAGSPAPTASFSRMHSLLEGEVSIVLSGIIHVP